MFYVNLKTKTFEKAKRPRSFEGQYITKETYSDDGIIIGVNEEMCHVYRLRIMFSQEQSTEIYGSPQVTIFKSTFGSCCLFRMQTWYKE